MKKLLIACFCASLLMSATVSAEVYKWKDKTGKTQYSDTPPLSNIPYTTLSGKKPVQPAQLAPAAETDPKKAAEAAKDGKPAPGAPANPNDPNASKNKVSEELKEKAAQEKAAKEAEAKEAEAKKQQEEKQQAEKKAKEQACKAARSKQAQFEQGGRIYRTNERGEREYYGDKEIAAELENAKSDVAENCE